MIFYKISNLASIKKYNEITKILHDGQQLELINCCFGILIFFKLNLKIPNYIIISHKLNENEEK